MYNSFSRGLLYEHGIFLHIKANCQVLAVLVAAFDSALGITLQMKAFVCGNAAQEACKYKSQNRWVSHFDTAEECYLGPPLLTTEHANVNVLHNDVGALFILVSLLLNQ